MRTEDSLRSARPLMNLDQLKKQIQGNAILGALLADGSITIVYKQPTEDSEKLFRTWTIEVLIVDDDYTDQVRSALNSLGYEMVQQGMRIVCTKDTAITPAERSYMAAMAETEEKARTEAAAEARESMLLATLEAMQAQIDELKQDLELSNLIKPKGGAQGQRGPAGSDGRDGRDLDATSVNLGDLQDVAVSDPRKGLVLTWTGIAWEARPTQTISDISGGGGGGGSSSGGGSITGNGLEYWQENSSGDLLPKGPSQDIGSASKPIGSLYATGNTIFLDNNPLSINESGRLAFDGNQLGYGDGNGDVEDAPLDGRYYVRQNGAWVVMPAVSGFPPDSPIDGGDFNTGESIALNDLVADGGDFTGAEA